MSTDQVRLERRAAQRFDFHLPVSVRRAGTDIEGHGFTQNLSGRGALFYTEFPLSEGNAVELTLVMPSEITLAENMRLRCRGRVTRVLRPDAGKFGVAVHLEGYEFLPEAETTTEALGSFGRIFALHQHSHEEKNPPHVLHSRSVPLP